MKVTNHKWVPILQNGGGRVPDPNKVSFVSETLGLGFRV